MQDNEELAYREEVGHLMGCCTINNLDLNVNKSKEVLVDFRTKQPKHMSLSFGGGTVEIIQSTKFLGVL